MTEPHGLLQHGEFKVIASRNVGRWHRRRRESDGAERFYRWIRFVGYVRVPRKVTPWAVT